MALIAPFKQTFGSVEAYYYLRQYLVDRATGGVGLTIEVYRDAETRSAYKAAEAEITRLQREISKRNGLADKDRVSTLALEHQLEQMFAARREAAPAEQNISTVIPPEDIKISKDGSVSVKDIYAWIRASHLADAKDA